MALIKLQKPVAVKNSRRENLCLELFFCRERRSIRQEVPEELNRAIINCCL